MGPGGAGRRWGPLRGCGLEAGPVTEVWVGGGARRRARSFSPLRARLGTRLAPASDSYSLSHICDLTKRGEGCSLYQFVDCQRRVVRCDARPRDRAREYEPCAFMRPHQDHIRLTTCAYSALCAPCL